MTLGSKDSISLQKVVFHKDFISCYKDFIFVTFFGKFNQTKINEMFSYSGIPENINKLL